MTAGEPRPFAVDMPQARIDALYRRLADTTIGYAPCDDAAWRYGTHADYLAAFRDSWIDGYDWRAAEREVNAFPRLVAAIDGLAIFAITFRGPGADRLPVILTHGGPGSLVEFLGVIDRLVHPERFGGRAEDGLDVVIPSLPGYGLSERPPAPIGPRRIGAIWRTLMIDTLGYRRFGAQGGDWGSAVAIALAGNHGDAETLRRGRIDTPTGVARFPVDVLPSAPRAVVEQGFKVVHWSEFETGGHFAAWEQPEAFARDVTRFFCDYR